MKLFLLITILSIGFSQSMKGKISFLLGSASFKVEGIDKWKPVQLNETVFPNWIIKTSTDAELEISWENGTSSEISSDQNVTIASLLKDMKVETSWFDRIKAKLGVLFTKSKKSSVKDVAGIRQSEVTIAAKDSLYWMAQSETSFDDAYALYLNNESEKALPLLLKIINENPLSPQAELSLSCLIIIYSDKGDKVNAQKQLERLIKDFPESEMKRLAEEGKSSL